MGGDAPLTTTSGELHLEAKLDTNLLVGLCIEDCSERHCDDNARAL
jgi:hypothetical protein